MLRILIAGEGGQGVQALGQILNSAAHRQGLKTFYIPNYGVEQRGGISLAFVQISESPIPYPKFKKADFLVLLCERAIPRVKSFVTKKTKILNGIGFVGKPEEHNLSPKTFNMLILGILSGFLPLQRENLLKAMAERFKGKSKKLLSDNKKAFVVGRGLGLNLPRWAKKIKPISIKDHRKWPPKISENEKVKVTIHPQYCKSCGICIERCPTKALHFSQEITGIYGIPITEVDISKCIGCGLCERVCPDTAVEVKKKK